MAIDFEGGVAGVEVVGFFHLFDRIEVTDDEGGTEGLAGFDRAAAEFLDHADIAALVASGFGDDRGRERHSGEPRTRCAGLCVAELIRGSVATQASFGLGA